MENNISIDTDPSCALHAEVIQDFRATWIFYSLISVNIALCITATLGNALILVSLQVCHLRPPSKLLFRSLASTDLCVGLVSQPCFVIFVSVSVAGENGVIAKGAVLIYSAILRGISLNTLTAISMDRLLALLLGLPYRHTVTLVRVPGIIIISWLVLTLHSMLYFWSARIFTITVVINILLCIVVSSFCYTKIYCSLRYRQAQVLQQSEPDQLNFPAGGHMLRYKKTVSNSLWLYIAVTLFYLPYTSLTIVTATHGDSKSTMIAEGITGTLVYLSSSLNPIIYCWRIREVRKAVMATIRHARRFCFVLF